MNVAQVLTAGANNDVLTGLRIAPTFTNGAYTGVKNYGLIVESGNVGIGTTSPGTKLDIAAAAGAVGALTIRAGGHTIGDVPYMQFTDDNLSAGLKIGSNGGNGKSYVNSYGDLSFGVGNTFSERMRILDTGNVGIGTTSPSYNLDITGGLRATATSTFSGYVGIGTVSPGYLLTVNGTAYVNSLISSGSSSAGTFTSYTTTDAVLQGRTGYGVDIRYNGGTLVCI